MTFRLEDLFPSWHKDARCFGVGNDYYFGTDQGTIPTMSFTQVRQASKLCDVCPVYTECLRWSLENREEYGVWAGTSGRVRRDIFFLLDREEITVDEVIERYRSGQGHTIRELRAAYGEDRGGRRGHDLRDAPVGEIAAGDR